MKGFPKFNIGDKVHFEFTINNEKYSEDGEIVVVDKYGTWDDDSDVSYDIKLEDGSWWKHINEKFVTINKSRKIQHL